MFVGVLRWKLPPCGLIKSWPGLTLANSTIWTFPPPPGPLCLTGSPSFHNNIRYSPHPPPRSILLESTGQLSCTARPEYPSVTDEMSKEAYPISFLLVLDSHGVCLGVSRVSSRVSHSPYERDWNLTRRTSCHSMIFGGSYSGLFQRTLTVSTLLP